MLKYTEEEKKEILEKYKNNVGSQYEFCKKNNINRSTLRGWLRKQEKVTHKTTTNNEKIDFGVITLKTPNAVKTTTESAENIPITITCSKIKIEAKEYNTTLLKEIMEVLNDAK